jgi:hypothetical protein
LKIVVAYSHKDEFTARCVCKSIIDKTNNFAGPGPTGCWVDGDLLVGIPAKDMMLVAVVAHGWPSNGTIRETHHATLVIITSIVFVGMLQTKIVSAEYIDGEKVRLMTLPLTIEPLCKKASEAASTILLTQLHACAH